MNVFKDLLFFVKITFFTSNTEKLYLFSNYRRSEIVEGFEYIFKNTEYFFFPL